MMVGNLLIVDDEEDVLGVLSEYLSTLGYGVVAVASGREAVAHLASDARFDVAIIDWTLPDVGGRELIQVIRARQPSCRIIVTTGHGADVVNETNAGPFDGTIVRKPFTMRTLSMRVAMLLEKSRAER